jgi:hypothetical protein
VTCTLACAGWLGILACTRPAPRVAAHAGGPTVRERLEDACGPCHPGKDGRPGVDRMVSDVNVARRSLQRVSAGQMPPPPSSLAFEARKPLIHGLCEVASTDPARCYDAYSLGQLPSLMRWPSELSADIQSRWQLSDAVAGSLDEGLSSASSQPSHETPTTDAILVIGAVAGCTERGKQDATFDVGECVRSIIARDFIRAPEPAR